MLRCSVVILLLPAYPKSPAPTLEVSSMPNPFLTEAPRAPRCSICGVSLLDGRCLDCGMSSSSKRTMEKPAVDSDGSDGSESADDLEQAFDNADYLRDRLEQRHIRKVKRAPRAEAQALTATGDSLQPHIEGSGDRNSCKLRLWTCEFLLHFVGCCGHGHAQTPALQPLSTCSNASACSIS